MAITAGRAIEEGIRHPLGSTPSSELDEIGLVNYAGHALDRMHRWKFREGRSVVLVLEEGVDKVRLPIDLQQIRHIRSTNFLGRGIQEVPLERIHWLRSWSTDARGALGYLGAVTHDVPPPANLLRYSEALNQSGAWTPSSGVTVSAGAAVDPSTGTQTAERVEDGSTSVLGDLVQTIPVRFAETGKHCLGITLRPSPLATNPSKSAVSLETEDPADDGLQSLMEITWGEEPERDPPTVWIDPDASGGASVRVVKAEGEAYWTLAIEGHAHDLAKQLGRIKCRIVPALAAAASANGTSSASATGAVEVARAWVHRGLKLQDYAETGAELVVSKAPRPILEVWPNPTTIDTEEFTLFYRSTWADVEDSSDSLPLPEWIEPLYVEVLRSLAKGWEEEDEATFSQRLTMVRGLELFHQMAVADGLVQSSFGKPKGGMREHRRRPVLTGWEDHGWVTGPTL